MGSCIQSLQNTFEESQKRREENQRKRAETKYARLRDNTNQQAQSEEARFMKIAADLAGYAKGITELENDTELPEDVRLAQKRILLAKQQAAKEQMGKIEREMCMQIRKQAQIDSMESLLDEKKKLDEFTKLVKEIPAFDTRDLEKKRDKVNDTLEDMEDKTQDKLDSADLSAFSYEIELQLKASEERQKKPTNTAAATNKPGYSSSYRPVPTLVINKPPTKLIASSSSSSSTNVAAVKHKHKPVAAATTKSSVRATRVTDSDSMMIN